MDIKKWIKKGWSDEIEAMANISKVTEKEALTKFCANNPKDKATGSVPTPKTEIIVEGKNEFKRFSSVSDLLSCGNFEVGTVHTHPRATNENLRLSIFDRKNAEENENVTCVANTKGKVVCEDHRFDPTEKFSFMID